MNSEGMRHITKTAIVHYLVTNIDTDKMIAGKRILTKKCGFQDVWHLS